MARYLHKTLPAGELLFTRRADPRSQGIEDSSPRKEIDMSRFTKRAALATLVATVVVGAGFTAFAWGHGFGGWRHGGFMHGAMDPAKMEAHLDRMLPHLYLELGATDVQKQQLDPIVKSAARDLIALRGKLHDEKRQALGLLTSPQVDRTALEALRQQHVQLHEELSKRVTQALADVADVLTPEQRKQLGERIGRMRGWRG